MREKEAVEMKGYQKFWVDQNNKIIEKEKEYEQGRARVRKDLQSYHLSQMEFNSKQRQEVVRQELDQADQVKTFLEQEDKHFKSWAEQAFREWNQDGKNVKPMLLTLQKGFC